MSLRNHLRERASGLTVDFIYWLWSCGRPLGSRQLASTADFRCYSFAWFSQTVVAAWLSASVDIECHYSVLRVYKNHRRGAQFWFLVVQNACCSCGGAGFSSQHSHGNSQLSVIAVQGSWCPLLAFSGSRTHMVHMNSSRHTTPHRKIVNKWTFKNYFGWEVFFGQLGTVEY